MLIMVSNFIYISLNIVYIHKISFAHGKENNNCRPINPASISVKGINYYFKQRLRRQNALFYLASILVKDALLSTAHT